MFTLTHKGQYLTAQGARPYLTSNPRVALVFDSEHDAERVAAEVEPIMGIKLKPLMGIDIAAWSTSTGKGIA